MKSKKLIRSEIVKVLSNTDLTKTQLLEIFNFIKNLKTADDSELFVLQESQVKANPVI